MTRRLEPLGPDLWIADGQPVRGAGGFDFPTRMPAVRTGAGVWLWSPVMPDAALLAQVAAIGRVTDIVAPSGLHIFFLGTGPRTGPEPACTARRALRAGGPT